MASVVTADLPAPTGRLDDKALDALKGRAWLYEEVLDHPGRLSAAMMSSSASEWADAVRPPVVAALIAEVRVGRERKNRLEALAEDLHAMGTLGSSVTGDSWGDGNSAGNAETLIYAAERLRAVLADIPNPAATP